MENSDVSWMFDFGRLSIRSFRGYIIGSDPRSMILVVESGDMSFNYSGKRRQYGVCYLVTIAAKGWTIAQSLLSLEMAIDSVIELAIDGLCGSAGCVPSTESDKNL